MKTSQTGINLIKQFEGCRLEAYKCPAGVWTIGYGHTAGVRPGQKISAAQAEAYLRSDLENYEKKVDKYRGYGWSQNEFDAMVSFAYNLGSIDKLTANGTRSKTVIAEKILLYNKAGGKVLVGLTRRREAERNLFLSVSKERTTIRMGCCGDDVEFLQRSLSDLGYSVGKSDGMFGEKTFQAVKRFQKDNKLTVDGIVGKKTWGKLQDLS